MNFPMQNVCMLGAIHILHNKDSQWVGLQDAYNCFWTLGKQAHFSTILLIVGGL